MSRDKRNRRPDEQAEDWDMPQDDRAFAHEDFWDGVPEDTFEHEPLLEEEARVYPHSIFKPAVKQPNFILCVLVNVVRIFAVLILVVGLALVGAVLGIAKGYMETAPSLDLAALDEQAQTSFIYDANGNLITEYKGIENRVMVSIQAMPTYLQQAFVAVEDARFYTHTGVDVKRIVGAFVSNLTSSSTQGGSTITQQLIKNTLLSSEQSYKRKIQEAYLALQLETRYTKEEILECYLNTIWLGESYYGVQTAAEGYFGKQLSELTLRECAMLAGTCNSPYYYNPRRNFYTRAKEGVDYVSITNNRTDYVLRCMYENQFITWEQYQEALNPLTANVLKTDPNTGTGMYDYAHYVEYAVTEVVDILLELNDLEDTTANRNAMENKLRTGGYRVQLAIDTNIQRTVEETLEKWTKYPSLRDPSDKIYRARNSDGTYDEIIQPQAAAVVLDYRTGELKAIVGSRTIPTVKKTLNRAVDMNMPVGSSIKPIAVYAPAIELGASPASIVSNMPLPISGWKDDNGRDTWPRNYGGSYYAGPQTLRQAIVNSHNTAAAQTLMTMVGVERSVDFLHRLGIDDDHIDATPFGLSLGSSGITPLQMAVAFGVLADGGVYQEPISVLGISDSEGNVVWDGHAQQERRRVFSESTAYLVVDMLKDAVKSGTGTNAKISGQTVAGKTGTNSDQKGVFFAGMTGYYSSALWVGHDNYKALSSKTTGSSAAAPLWQAYMKKIHEGLSNKDILDGDASQYGLVKATTCAVSGQLATDACRSDVMDYGVVTDWWASGTVPTVYCQMHSMQTICLESGEPASPYCWNTAEQGVISIPQGHPLYQFLGTQYEDVLIEYLGSYSVYGARGTCSWHTTYSENPVVENTLIPDALVLLSQAQNRLLTMDVYSEQYSVLQSAITNLQGVISMENPSTSEVAAAMGRLTQAMAGLY
ncbi:MAG: PBP1A family penicillin-binding protein [Clostridia bacterium]|nr:PBP1A family penicillin-binding protein [Clostridia bacterium]